MSEAQILTNLFQSARKLLEKSESTEEFEPAFAELLDFIRGHSQVHHQALAIFSALLKGVPGVPHELLSFCMHELRWPEILQEAQTIKRVSDDPRDKAVMEAIIDSFNSDWSERDLYRRYRS